MFAVKSGAQSLSRLGARTKMLFLNKWSPGVKQWSLRALNFPSWSPGALQFFGRSPGALNPFGTLNSVEISEMEDISRSKRSQEQLGKKHSDLQKMKSTRTRPTC